MKRIPAINKLLRDKSLTTKVKIYFSQRTTPSNFNPREENYTYTNLNPITVNAYIREVKPETLVWNQMGLREMGAKELIVEDKYENHFRIANKIVIEDDEYQVYRDKAGENAAILKRPHKLIRVTLTKKKGD